VIRPFRTGGRRQLSRQSSGGFRIRCGGYLVPLAGHCFSWNGNFLEIPLFVLQFEKIGNVEESIAFQTDVDKSRLHARQYACHPAFVNGTRESVFVLPLKINFC